jgi:Tfp pilus assembly protein PilF
MLSSLVLLAMTVLAPAPLPSSEPVAFQASEAATSAAQADIDAGLAAFRRLRFREAEKHFQAAVEADPQSGAATWYLAYTVYKIAEPKRPFHPDKQRAAQLFARAYELDPGFRPVWSR